MASSSYNLALLSIPAYYVLAQVPHAYAAYIATRGNLSKHDNRNPHSAQYQDKIKRSLNAKEYAAYERAKRCHQNALENMPLFVAAVFAGLMAERSAGAGSAGLNNFVVGWMGTRVVYTVNYLVTESKTWSNLRSAMYIVGVGWAFTVLGRAAYAVVSATSLLADSRGSRIPRQPSAAVSAGRSSKASKTPSPAQRVVAQQSHDRLTHERCSDHSKTKIHAQQCKRQTGKCEEQTSQSFEHSERSRSLADGDPTDSEYRRTLHASPSIAMRSAACGRLEPASKPLQKRAIPSAIITSPTSQLRAAASGVERTVSSILSTTSATAKPTVFLLRQRSTQTKPPAHFTSPPPQS